MKNRYFEDEIIKEGLTKNHYHRLLTYIKPYQASIMKGLVLILLSGVLASLGPYFMKVAIDDVLPSKEMIGILGITLLFIGIILGSIFLFKVRVTLVTWIGQSIIYDIREDVFKKLQLLPFSYYDERPHGKIIVRVVNYINAISDMLSQGIIDVLSEFISLFFVMAFMFSLNWRLSLFCFAITPITFGLVIYIRKQFHKVLRTLKNKESNMNAFIHESLTGIKITQSFVKEEENLDVLNNLMEQNIDWFMKSKRIKFLTSPVLAGAEAFVTILILYLGMVWVGSDTISLGIIVAFLGYMGQFWQPMMKISDFYAQMADAITYLERIFDIMEEEPDIKDTEDSRDVETMEGHIRFEDVDFSYDKDVQILKSFNLDVKPGETVAIVGPTGAGKSTIIHLISRFYEINQGSITIDGLDIHDITIKSLRKHMGIMQQDTFIFSDSVMENIRYGRLDASDEEVIEAAKAVSAHDFIMTMEEEYQTQVQENGSRLSVGQRQLIGLARIFLANPRIFILDEATSSIDTETERHIQKGLSVLFENRTTFVIAHRLSTIRHADRILFLDDGQIVEDGSHEELITKDGAYRHLYETQLNYVY